MLGVEKGATRKQIRDKFYEVRHRFLAFSSSQTANESLYDRSSRASTTPTHPPPRARRRNSVQPASSSSPRRTLSSPTQTSDERTTFHEREGRFRRTGDDLGTRVIRLRVQGWGMLRTEEGRTERGRTMTSGGIAPTTLGSIHRGEGNPERVKTRRVRQELDQIRLRRGGQGRTITRERTTWRRMLGERRRGLRSSRRRG